MELKENKFAIVIGHDEKDKGAFSSYLDLQEWSLFNNFAKAFLVEVGDIFTHDKTISSYTQRQVNTAQKTADYQYSFELHFNAAGPSANGCEALYYYKNENAKLIAEKYLVLNIGFINFY